MKTWIEHQWGKIERKCHVSSLQRAIVSSEEEDLALSLGFISTDTDKDFWYNCRSGRVRLKKNARKYKGNLVGLVEIPDQRTEHIYYNWIKRKKFTAYEGDEKFLSIDTCMHYYLSNELVAYSKIRIHANSAQLLINCSLFKNLAMDTLKYEMYWLKQQGKEYCYFGQGYERSSFWKAEQSTFEWWTGSKWSRNLDIFKQLCERDARIVYYETGKK